jgi:Ser/Thr protein kinase RdoA (MazF antagonist)
MAQTVRVVARLHELTIGLAVPYPRVRSGTEPRRQLRELLDLARQRRITPHESALRQLIDRAGRAVEDFEARIGPYKAGLPRGVVHHDAHCWNVLFQDDRLVALIDFDDAHEGYLLADIARLIATWAADLSTSNPLDLEKSLQVVREYQRHRPLTEAERELLPDFLLLSLLADTAGEVSGELELGGDANSAVIGDKSYKRYLHHLFDTEWLAKFRAQLWA